MRQISFKDLDYPAYQFHISYIGESFDGFQSQSNGNAIQDIFERACEIFFRHPVRIRGASRTDSGVHAEHQVILLRTSAEFESFRWKRGFNAILPDTIKVRSILPAESGFDPIYSAKAKVYCYRLWLGQCDNPMLRPFVWSVHSKLDIRKLECAFSEFKGRHDFTSFCNQGSYSATRIRCVIDTKVIRRDQLIEIFVLGEGFLKQMVRIMVGSSVDLALDRSAQPSIASMIALKSREHAGQTAPPQGLALLKIFFDTVPKLEDFISQRRQNSFCIGL